MSCGPKRVFTIRGARIPSSFNFKRLEKRGRLQFFFHSPSSELPVRDLLDEQRRGAKTEPHLEKGAENYCARCYQPNNIVPFLESTEKYLFLFTTAKRSERRYRNKKFIVGYIMKKKAIRRTDGKKKWWAVAGPTEMYSFEDSFPLEDLIRNPKNVRVKILNPDRTARVIQHFSKRSNILKECLAELHRLEQLKIRANQGNRTCG